MSYAGLLCDFDGTLHTRDHAVSSHVTDAILGLDIPFGIITGRQFQFVEVYLKAVGLGGVHVVAGGAQLVRADGTIVREARLAAQTMRDIYAAVEAQQGLVVIKHHETTYANPRYVDRIAARTGLPVVSAEHLQDWAAPAFYLSDIDESLWAALELRDDVGLCRQTFRSGKPGFFVDGVAKGVSKATGTGWWCNYHGLDPQTVIGIGDGENDIPFLQTVGLGLAMGNSVASLKTVADEEIPSVEQDGVAWAIQKYLAKR